MSEILGTQLPSFAVGKAMLGLKLMIIVFSILSMINIS